MTKVIFRKFDDLSKEAADWTNRYLRANYERALSHLIPNRQTVEHGLKIQFKTVDEEENVTEMKRMESSSVMPFESIAKSDFKSINRFLNEMLKSLNEVVAKSIYSSIHDITEKTGNVVDGGGQLLSADHLLEMNGTKLSSTSLLSWFSRSC